MSFRYASTIRFILYNKIWAIDGTTDMDGAIDLYLYSDIDYGCLPYLDKHQD